jgi:hypothetical protein
VIVSVSGAVVARGVSASKYRCPGAAAPGRYGVNCCWKKSFSVSLVVIEWPLTSFHIDSAAPRRRAPVCVMNDVETMYFLVFSMLVISSRKVLSDSGSEFRRKVGRRWKMLGLVIMILSSSYDNFAVCHSACPLMISPGLMFQSRTWK